MFRKFAILLWFVLMNPLNPYPLSAILFQSSNSSSELLFTAAIADSCLFQVLDYGFLCLGSVMFSTVVCVYRNDEMQSCSGGDTRRWTASRLDGLEFCWGRNERKLLGRVLFVHLASVFNKLFHFPKTKGKKKKKKKIETQSRNGQK